MQGGGARRLDIDIKVDINQAAIEKTIPGDAFLKFSLSFALNPILTVSLLRVQRIMSEYPNKRQRMVDDGHSGYDNQYADQWTHEWAYRGHHIVPDSQAVSDYGLNGMQQAEIESQYRMQCAATQSQSFGNEHFVAEERQTRHELEEVVCFGMV